MLRAIEKLKGNANVQMTWQKTSFGKLSTGQECHLFTIKTEADIEISVTDYGISLVSFIFNASDNPKDVLLGFDNVSDYESHDFYSGCIVGRVASRVANGKFELDGKEYQLSLNNNGDTHLHGGFVGLSKVVWDCEIVSDKILKFTHTQPDDTDGYPGNLAVVVTMTVNTRSGRMAGSYLSVDLAATCDQPTPINLTLHPYFNMDGHDYGTALDNKLTVFDYAGYLPMDPETILPTGDIVKCRGTPFNLDITRIGDQIADVPGGYDHTFHLCAKEGFVVPAAEIASKNQKYRVRVLTDQPGVHVYSGNFLDGAKGKGGAVYHKHSGIALEAQNFPNSVNMPSFPNCILREGEEYKRNITFALHRAFDTCCTGLVEQDSL